jgi:hypothetical protein
MHRIFDGVLNAQAAQKVKRGGVVPQLKKLGGKQIRRKEITFAALIHATLHRLANVIPSRGDGEGPHINCLIMKFTFACATTRL